MSTKAILAKSAKIISCKYFNQGFTLTELMVVIAISIVLLAIGIPMFREIIQTNRSLAISREFLSALNLARSEAVRRTTPVTICASAHTTEPSCGTVRDWANGWIVFADADSSGVLTDTSNLIRKHQPLKGNTVFTTTQAKITYTTTGMLNMGITNASISYTIAASGCYGEQAQIVSVTPTGHALITTARCP